MFVRTFCEKHLVFRYHQQLNSSTLFMSILCFVFSPFFTYNLLQYRWEWVSERASEWLCSVFFSNSFHSIFVFAFALRIEFHLVLHIFSRRAPFHECHYHVLWIRCTKHFQFESIEILPKHTHRFYEWLKINIPKNWRSKADVAQIALNIFWIQTAKTGHTDVEQRSKQKYVFIMISNDMSIAESETAKPFENRHLLASNYSKICN